MANSGVLAIHCAPLLRFEIILMILGCSQPMPTNRTVSPSTYGSCYPASASMAKKLCEDKGGILFSIDDLKMAHALRIMELAIEDLGDIWMFTNSANINVTGTCLTDVHNNRSCPGGDNCGDAHGCCKSTETDSTGVNTFAAVNCKQLRHYVCKINNTRQEFRGNRTNAMYIPCRTDRGTSSSAVPIIIGIVVAVAVVAGVIICCCCLIKCATKPIKYAVRVQSALYHKNNPEAEVVGRPQPKATEMLARHVVNLNNT